MFSVNYTFMVLKSPHFCGFQAFLIFVYGNNIILTETERLTMSSRPKNPKYARNKNILVVGGSGSGKTRFFVKPNIMQLHSSYCITDPKIAVF